MSRNNKGFMLSATHLAIAYVATVLTAAMSAASARAAWHFPGTFHVLTNGKETVILFTVRAQQSGVTIPYTVLCDGYMVSIKDGKLGRTIPVRGYEPYLNLQYVMWDGNIYAIENDRSRIRKIVSGKLTATDKSNSSDKQIIDAVSQGAYRDLEQHLDELMAKKDWRSVIRDKTPGYHLVDTGRKKQNNLPVMKVRPYPGSDVMFDVNGKRHTIFMDADGEDLLFRIQMPGMDRATEIHRFEGDHFDQAKRWALK